MKATDDPSAVRRTLKVSTFEGCLTQVFLNWTSGSVLTGFMIYLGAGPLALAALAAIPQLAQLLNPLTAWLATRIRRRKIFIIWSAILGRGPWLIPIVLPLVFAPGHLSLMWMLAMIAVSSVISNSMGLAWTALMADVVPEEIRGRYFGMRAAVVGIVGMAANLAAGWYLDRTAAPAGFQMVYVVALLFAIAGIYCFRWYHEPRVEQVRHKLSDALLMPLRDANFRRFLAFSMYWQGAVMLAAPFVIPYFLQELHLTFTQVAIWTAIASFTSLLTSPLWGRIGDRVGHKTVLTITTILAGTIHPLCWILATPGHLFFIWMSGVIDAVSWGGIHPAMFNLSLSTAPQSSRMAYLAVLSFFSGLVGFVAALASGPLLHFMLPYDFVVFGFHWTGYHSLFLASGLLRTFAWRLLARVDEPRAWTTGAFLRTIGARGLDLVTRPFARETT